MSSPLQYLLGHVRGWWYRTGHRPQPASILYSPSLNLIHSIGDGAYEQLMRTEQRLQKSEAETQRLQNEVTYQTNTAAAALGGLDRYEQRLQKSEAEVDRLRAALESADGVIRAVQDALGVEADTDAVIAAKKAAAEVARLQGSVDRVRALSASDAWSAYDEDLGSIQVMAADDVLAILDGEAQS